KGWAPVPHQRAPRRLPVVSAAGEPSRPPQGTKRAPVSTHSSWTAAACHLRASAALRSCPYGTWRISIATEVKRMSVRPQHDRVTLRLTTFGGLLLERDDAIVTGASAQRRKLALLAYLAVAGDRGASRDKLLGIFWPETDTERARHALSQTLSALRHGLKCDDLVLGTSDLRLN